MKLHRIIIVALALLPFSVCIAMENSSLVLTAAMNSLTLEQIPYFPSIALRPAPKKYRRNLVPNQEILIARKEFLAPKKINYDLIMLEVENFLDITSDHYEVLPDKHFTSIEANFKKTFGYPIPTSSDSWKKTDFKSFITHNAMLNTIEISTPWTIEKITKKVKQYLEIKDHEKKELLLEQIAEKERLCHVIAAENQRLRVITKELELETKKQENTQKKAELQEKKRRIIEAQKKERAQKAAQKKTIIQHPVQRPIKSIVEQKYEIKKALKKSSEYRCQTDKQLKTILSNQCTCCIFEQINSRSAFHYIKRTNELIILIDDEIDSYDFEHDYHVEDYSSSD